MHAFPLHDVSCALECPPKRPRPTCPAVHVLQSLAERDRVVEESLEGCVGFSTSELPP